ncbi:MAG: beta-galactosidase trimerization domain-containing protein [Lachnospiraceae bacterium]
MQELRYRQVHLDFHTSAELENIGEKFNKEEFQKTLQLGHVDSITLFSKCHHGWSYHPTKVNEMHPHLSFDLLRAQMEACKEINVKTPVYISAGLDEKEAIRHPEWLSRLPDESLTWVKDFITEPGFHLMCFGTGYLELLLNQIEEVMQLYHPEGIFLDISAVHPCYCAKCRGEIIKRGKDPRDMDAVMEQAELVYQNYAVKVEKLIHSYHPDCTIFHNAGHITRGRRDIAHYNTHLELESLPTGGWGYDHFPMSAAYVSNLNMEYLGMTGKFHTTWGEFGGFKHPNALRYEVALSVAFGAKCSIGDQLHPLGKLDEGTYKTIGKAYAEVEEKEAWLKGAVNCYEIGILGDEAVNSKVSNRDVQRYADIGANRIMLEGKYLYRFIDLMEDFTKFKVIILPDTIRLNEELQQRLSAYIAQGGKILASGLSGTKENKLEFGLDFGAKIIEENPFKPDYVVPKFDFVTGRSAHIMYEQGYLLEAMQGEVVAYRETPYFNRDIAHFTSHQHTPNDPTTDTPGMVMTENTAYISWNIFTDYGKIGSLHLKEMVVYALEHLLAEEAMIKVKFIDRGVMTLTKQAEEKRYVNHFLYAHTSIRGNFMWEGEPKPMEIIEDIVPIRNIEVSIKTKESIKNVYLAPQMEKLAFTCQEGRVVYTVPEVNCHQMVILDYNI